jgi:hypothetical protein
MHAVQFWPSFQSRTAQSQTRPECALWTTISADRENLVRQEAMLVEIHDTIRHTSEMILSSQNLIRQLDWMSDAAWHHPYPGRKKYDDWNREVV